MSTLRADNLQSLDQAHNKAVASLVDDKSLVDRVNYDSDADFVEAKAGLLSIDEKKRVRAPYIIAGDEELSGGAQRDAIVVGRTVEGLTDCHAFADRTVIDGVTDYGGYGTFDGTTILRGSNAQDHMFTFQDRNSYEGSGSIQAFYGMILRPTQYGTGHIASRVHIDVTGLRQPDSAGGTCTSEAAINVRQMSVADSSVVLRTDQAKVPGKESLNIFFAGDAPSVMVGALKLGKMGLPGSIFEATSPGVGSATAFIESSPTSVFFGSQADAAISFYANALPRLEILSGASGGTVRPGTANTQLLGDSGRYWSGGYFGTAPQVVSDARKKTEVRKLSVAEIKAAKELVKEIGIWQFLESISDKGADGARLHVSMTVQRAIEIFASNGLDAMRYGFICHDVWGDEFTDHPAETVEHPATDDKGTWTETVKEAWTEQTRKAGDLYSFREQGLLFFMAAGLEARISALEDA
ncbi:tail fiber domain-containing protein [Pseudomonas sp. WS 5079]|uniref:tail fiber domain-containing protein n=1 Tax=Pseudomonas sp. WS 5079 TaxID=2717492 RepID=UPI001556E6FA|nr:tail fiber domain-containing protein [Pseudomonas sp. WS 5079]NMX65415.1 tail fiber domain-containing protein [Pseudomonas sp. WS 5079]